MGFLDLVLFCLVTGMTVRWIAAAATLGPAAITVWVGACLFFALPLLVAVLELSTRFPEREGGIYDWSQRALGEWSGFMTGWTYWTSNLPYFPALLVFAAGAFAYLVSADPNNRTFVLSFSLLALWIATLLNVVGLKTGKWLHNVGALTNWGTVLVVIAAAFAAWHRFGSATTFSWRSLVPHSGIKEAVFWSSIVFAVAGSEASAFLRQEVADAKRVFPRALLVSGVICASGYILGTVAMLVILPVEQVSGLGGIMDAAASVSTRVSWHGLVPLVAVLLVVANVGGVGAWLTATARLPFVAGIDRYLPASFGRLHPRFGTPHLSFFWQAGLATAFILLSQAGTTVAGAYQILVSMGIISYFLPYLFTFASLWRVQTMPAGADVIRPPGKMVTARVLAASGFIVTFAGIILACIPDAAEPNKPLAVLKVVGSMVLLVVVGQAVYLGGARGRAAPASDILGPSSQPYKNKFEKGALVQVRSRAALEQFRREWKLHHSLSDDQMQFAGIRAGIRSVCYYHGGDVLYVLDCAPRCYWHEACLEAGDRPPRPPSSPPTPAPPSPQPPA